MASRKSNITSVLEYALIVLHSLTLLFVIFREQLELPTLLATFGRTHPLLLHFPIVLLLLLAVLYWFPKGIGNKGYSQLKLFLSFTLVLTGLSVLAGLLLSTEPGYLAEEIKLHKWTGVGVFWLATVWWLVMYKSKIVGKACTIGVFVLVLVTGHLGASLTHGEDFLVAHLQKEQKVISVSYQEALAFEHVVQPILNQKCISCHKASKQKGELRLDKISFIQKGGASGKVIDYKNPENSLLLQKIHLPLTDEDHMPPKGKPQLTSSELAILTAWIKESADFKMKLVDFSSESELKNLTANLFEMTEEHAYSFGAAPEKNIEGLRNEYTYINPMHPESPALVVRLFGKEKYHPDKLKTLQKIQIQVVDLNLSKLPIKDNELRFLSKFENLEKLNLAETELTGQTLDELQGLEKLKQLSLVGITISDDGWTKLGMLTQLVKLYIWNTNFTEEIFENLKKALPATQIERGYEDDGTLYKLNPPKIRYDSAIFQTAQTITLSHPISNVKLCYTLDNSEPDSLHSAVYTEEIRIDKTTMIRVKGYAHGWLGSEETKQVLLKNGVTPDLFKLVSEPDEKYKGIGVETLFDKVKGDEGFASGKWLGFQKEPMELMLGFDHESTVNRLDISYLSHENSHIFPPQKVEVWAVDHNGSMLKLKEIRPNQPLNNRSTRTDVITLEFEPLPTKQLRVKVTPIGNLPQWHPAAGQQGWIFVDEILIN